MDVINDIENKICGSPNTYQVLHIKFVLKK